MQLEEGITEGRNGWINTISNKKQSDGRKEMNEGEGDGIGDEDNETKTERKEEKGGKILEDKEQKNTEQVLKGDMDRTR